MGRLNPLRRVFLPLYFLNILINFLQTDLNISMTVREDLKNFGLKKIREIKLWAWAAAILPIIALAGIFFIWMFGTQEMLNISMIIGSTTMFTAAVIWWWWAIHTMYNLIVLWNKADEAMQEVKVDIKEIKQSIREFFFSFDK